MKTFSLVLALVFIAGTVHASPPAGGKKEGGGNRYQAGFTIQSEFDVPADLPDEGRSVDIPKLVVPVFRDGILENYVFVSLRLQVADGVDIWSVRERSHYLRDALIKASHRQPLAGGEDMRSVNREQAAAVWRATANQVLGEEKISEVVFMGVDSRD